MHRLLPLLLASTAVFGADPTLAQSGPRPAAPLALRVKPPEGPAMRARGYTHAGYLGHGRYPLLLILCDRDPAPLLNGLPVAVLDRKRVVAVALEVGRAELEPAGLPRLQQLLAAAVDEIDRTWSIDRAKVHLLGLGRTASRALAVARSGAPPVRSAIAWAPVDDWQPATAAAQPPTLVVTTDGKQERTGEALAAAAASRCMLHECGSAEHFDDALQPILEWLLASAEPPPKAAIDRVQGRTVAARGSKQRVVVVKGDYDDVERVLTLLEIPHVELAWAELERFDLDGSDVLLVNCSTGDGYQMVAGRTLKKLRQFVDRGGFLFTTDWALRFPLLDLFGDQLGCVDPGVQPAAVAVLPAARGYNQPLLQHVFPLDQPPPRWQLDGQSWLLDIKAKARVDVLLDSEEMGKAYGGNRAIGVCLQAGAYGGTVLHVVSHFGQQGEGAETPMYQLIVNFIDAAKQQRERRR